MSFLQISNALLDNEIIIKLKPKHYKIFTSFLRLLNFCNQIVDNHGKKITILPGEIMITYRDLAKRFNVDKGVIERLFSKLRRGGIIGIKRDENIKKPRQEKTIFFLEEKYRVIKKTETRNQKTETRNLANLPRQNQDLIEKTETQIYTHPHSSSLRCLSKGALACARQSVEKSITSSPLRELPPVSMKQKERQELAETFLGLASLNGHEFPMKTVLWWIRVFGIKALTAQFYDMIAPYRKVKIDNPGGLITAGLKKGYVPEKDRIEKNRLWLESYVKENNINYIEITKKYCVFKHISYNEQVKYELLDFKEIIINRINMLKERQEGIRYG